MLGKLLAPRCAAAGAFATALLLATTLPALAGAVETPLTVRVISQGAKFVGTSMGGVQVTVRDALTGELLAAGRTHGSTGDTDRIMREAHTRGETVYATDGSARFDAVLDLDRPRQIEITAVGPLAQAQSAARVSVTRWAIPGKPLDRGDGVLLELPGFVVDVLAPPAHVVVQGTAPAVAIEANVTMMCGCPVTPGGLWDAERFEVGAIVSRDGERLTEIPLAYAGSASQFSTTWTAPGPGAYEVAVYAWDPESSATGLDRTTFIVRGE